jgi:hypothetical protein
MGMHIPAPLQLPWQLKPPSSASAGVETLHDGRQRYWVKHSVLKNVTPRMLAWWFGHMEGDVEIQGCRYPRYRAWHPRDHVYRATCDTRQTVRLVPERRSHCASTWRATRITRSRLFRPSRSSMRPDSFIKCSGAAFASLEWSTCSRKPRTARVTRTPRLGRFANLLLPFLFPDGKGQAWLKHSIEEMGTLENFLPELYEREAVDQVARV